MMFTSMARDLEIKPTIIDKIIDETASKIQEVLPELDKQFADGGYKSELIKQIEELIAARTKQLS